MSVNSSNYITGKLHKNSHFKKFQNCLDDIQFLPPFTQSEKVNARKLKFTIDNYDSEIVTNTNTYKYLELAQKLIDTYPGSAIGYDNAYIEELEDHICEAEKGDKHIIDQKAEKTIREMRFEYKGCPPFFDALFKKESEKLCNEFPCWSTKCPTHGKDNRGR